ncbi:PIN domain-containing protein [Candidatus Woesearchaeota archaeon]|nr:PIN domain-containing protein [Candidatus Woesearchaeota archaeon]
MDLVIDVNVLFSALIKRGKTEELLFKEAFHLFAPEFLFDEFEAYRERILEKTERPSLEFDALVQILKKRIKTLPRTETEPFLPAAKHISPDPKDVEYFAAALRLRCGIWSQDRALEKQDVVPVYSTEKLAQLV